MFDLSIIIPSHNKSQYIGKCLESVFGQTLSVKEVIVFDDKSTDNTLDVLREFQAQHDNLTVIQSQENVGVSVARDTAIKRATSDYITFIDADDFYYDS